MRKSAQVMLQYPNFMGYFQWGLKERRPEEKGIATFERFVFRGDEQKERRPEEKGIVTERNPD